MKRVLSRRELARVEVEYGIAGEAHSSSCGCVWCDSTADAWSYHMAIELGGIVSE